MPLSDTESPLASSPAAAAELVKALSDAVHHVGGNDNHLRRLLSDGILVRRVARLLVDEPVTRLQVDPELTRAERLAACGLSHLNAHVNEENFPVTPVDPDLEVTLIEANGWSDYDEAMHEITRRGLRPATLDELCVYATQPDDRFRLLRIIALGSIWVVPDGDRAVPMLDQDGSERWIGVSWLSQNWRPSYHFLAVRDEDSRG
jgi:hypothetical protein